MRWIKWLSFIVLLGMVAFFALAPPLIESSLNGVLPHPEYGITPAAAKLHQSLIVGDLHADSTLWQRDLRDRASRGHVDLPRLRDGNVALQAFTFVTKTPAGMNYESNASDARDNITLLAFAQRWPLASWRSLSARALYQASRLNAIADAYPDELRVLRQRTDLDAVQEARAEGSQLIGALMGIEGSHALDGKLENIAILWDAGIRMFGLHHFFDNKLGGSLHGQGGKGLSAFGREVVAALVERGAIIDVAHSSPESVRDVLAMTEQALVVSHTGFQGNCATPRNIEDGLMQELAARGSLIGVGYWDAAVCDVSPEGIVAAIRYGIDLLGVEHVALGSDYDGSTTVPLDTAELAVLTQVMLDRGFSEREIRLVMGGNMRRFLQENLPEA
ncbi:MAG: membrane dipeptidase [Congregibacter sp.]